MELINEFEMEYMPVTFFEDTNGCSVHEFNTAKLNCCIDMHPEKTI